MPLQKPSPHRFIAPTPHTPKPKPKPKPIPTSHLRHATSARPAPPAAVHGHPFTPKRFVRAAVAAAPLGREESIEDASQSSASRAGEEGDSVTIDIDVAQTIERDDDDDDDDDKEEDDEEGDGGEMLFEATQPSKRRRTTPTPAHTHTLHSTPLTAPRRFRLAQPPPTTPSSFITPFTPSTPSIVPPSRPHFLPAPAPPTSSMAHHPPADFFSPSRRAQKYIPGGLASRVQSWILDAAPANGGVVWERGRGRGQDGERERDVRVRVRVGSVGGHGQEAVECWAGGLVFVSGEREGEDDGTDEEREMRILLAGRGGARAAGAVKISVGSLLGIRAPTWQLDVAGEKWTVGVDWLVL